MESVTVVSSKPRQGFRAKHVLNRSARFPAQKGQKKGRPEAAFE
jgi:hypothetical protein